MTWLIGAGPMAVEHARVLLALGEDFQVFGRSQGSAEQFEDAIGVPVQIADNARTPAFSAHAPPESAIVAVSPEQLAPVTSALLDIGVKRILLEKPGAMSFDELQSLRDKALRSGADILIAYNRRFFESVRTARKIIHDDGGVLSFNFEITEWAYVIGALDKRSDVLRSWFLANTTHVVDLAWYLGGTPEEMHCFHAGSLDWHPASSRFAGAGITRTNALFSYSGNWQSPGRWALEFCTPANRLIFRPMEQLHVQKIGSVAIEQLELDDALDQAFKPGIYRQMESFLGGDDSDFCHIDAQAEAWQRYEMMAGYQR
jgi:predicted dehydrogenase